MVVKNSPVATTPYSQPEVAFQYEGKWYSFPLLSDSSWNEVDIVPFTQRLGTGSLSLTDLTGIAAVEQASFAGGSGQRRLIELNRYYSGRDVWTADYDYGVSLAPKENQSYIGTNDGNSIVPGVHHAYSTTISVERDGAVVSAPVVASGSKVYIIRSGVVEDITGNLLTVAQLRELRNSYFYAELDGWFIVGDRGTVDNVPDGPYNTARLKYDPNAGTSPDHFIGIESYPVGVIPRKKVKLQFKARHVAGPSQQLQVIVTPHKYNPVGRYYYVPDDATPIDTVITLDGVMQPYEITGIELGEAAFIKVEFRHLGDGANTSTVLLTEVLFFYESMTDFHITGCTWNGYALLLSTTHGVFYLHQSVVDRDPHIVYNTTPASSATWVRSTWRVADASAIGYGDGYVWYAEGNSNLIHYGADPLGRDLEWGTSVETHPRYWRVIDGTIEGDVAAIPIGGATIGAKHLLSFNGAMYVFKEDGAWAVYWDGINYIPRQALAFEASSDNFNEVVVHDGSLVFNTGHKVWRYTGDTLVDITPEIVGSNGDKEKVVSLDTVADILFALTPSGKVVYFLNGSWHDLYELKTIDTNIDATFFDALRVESTGQALAAPGGVEKTLHFYTRYAPFLSANSNKFFYFNVNLRAGLPMDSRPEGKILTSWIDGGLAVVDKCFESLTVEFAFTSNAHGQGDPVQEIDVYMEYRTPDSKYIREYLGTIIDVQFSPHMTQTDLVRHSITLDIPRIVAREARFEFVLKSTYSTSSPRLYGYMVKYVPRPPYLKGYGMTLVVADNARLRSGVPVGLSAREQLDVLWAIRDSRRPVLYRDMYGNESWVYLSAIRVDARGENPVAANPEYHVTISLVETENAFGSQLPTP